MNLDMEIIPKFAMNPITFRQNLKDNTFTNLDNKLHFSLKNLGNRIINEYNMCNDIPLELKSRFSLSTYTYTSYENLGNIPDNPYEILAQKIMNGEYIPVNGIKLS
jgi:hypothetical protein